MVWDHNLYLPYSKRYLEADQGALPTGKILTAAPGSINDFASKPDLLFGHSRNVTGFKGNCGADGVCEGYNGYWLIEGAPKDASVLTISSAFSGVKADLRTDQPGVVLYSCSWMDGSAILKSTQGISPAQRVVKSSCVAIEAQDYPDGINQYVNTYSPLCACQADMIEQPRVGPRPDPWTRREVQLGELLDLRPCLRLLGMKKFEGRFGRALPAQSAVLCKKPSNMYLAIA